MSVKLKKRPAAGVANPPATHMALFTDLNGVMSVKDSDGVVTPLLTVDGSPLTLNTVVSAPDPVAETVKIYSKIINGRAELFVRDDAGTEIQITSLGTINLVANTLPTVVWKDGELGNPFVNGDTVTAAFNTIIMISTTDSEFVQINLPVITESSAGRVIHIRNLVDKKFVTPGFWVVTPNVEDSVETFPAGMPIGLNEIWALHTTFESDGVSRWNFTIVGGGSDLLEPFFP